MVVYRILVYGMILVCAIASGGSVLAQDAVPQGERPEAAPPSSTTESVDGGPRESQAGVGTPPAQTGQAVGTVPLPERVAWAELRSLQTTEQEHWRKLEQVRIGGSVTAITVGTPLAITFIMWGALLMTDASDPDLYEDESEARADRRTGGALLGLGLAAATGVALGAWRVAVQRRRRSAATSELRRIATRRTFLEQMLEWHYAVHARPPG